MSVALLPPSPVKRSASQTAGAADVAAERDRLLAELAERDELVARLEREVATETNRYQTANSQATSNQKHGRLGRGKGVGGRGEGRKEKKKKKKKKKKKRE